MRCTTTQFSCQSPILISPLKSVRRRKLSCTFIGFASEFHPRFVIVSPLSLSLSTTHENPVKLTLITEEAARIRTKEKKNQSKKKGRKTRWMPSSISFQNPRRPCSSISRHRPAFHGWRRWWDRPPQRPNKEEKKKKDGKSLRRYRHRFRRGFPSSTQQPLLGGRVGRVVFFFRSILFFLFFYWLSSSVGAFRNWRRNDPADGYWWWSGGIRRITRRSGSPRRWLTGSLSLSLSLFSPFFFFGAVVVVVVVASSLFFCRGRGLLMAHQMGRGLARSSTWRNEFLDSSLPTTKWLKLRWIDLESMGKSRFLFFFF